MLKSLKTETLILGILWLTIITTYPVVLFTDYAFHQSDLAGLVALLLVSIVSFLRKEIAFQLVLVLLLLGTFNILSFIYFFNLIISPGIQLYSLVLLGVLIYKRRSRFTLKRELTPEKKKDRPNTRNRFLSKFEKLSDTEIEEKLKQDLALEAKQALEIIQKQRNS